MGALAGLENPGVTDAVNLPWHIDLPNIRLNNHDLEVACGRITENLDF